LFRGCFFHLDTRSPSTISIRSIDDIRVEGVFPSIFMLAISYDIRVYEFELAIVT
jgi:hypothetical protein